jgi:hypothetical protein
MYSEEPAREVKNPGAFAPGSKASSNFAWLQSEAAVPATLIIDIWSSIVRTVRANSA